MRADQVHDVLQREIGGRQMPQADILYERLPNPVKDNLTEEQWREARRGVIHEGQEIPETTIYHPSRLRAPAFRHGG